MGNHRGSSFPALLEADDANPPNIAAPKLGRMSIYETFDCDDSGSSRASSFSRSVRSGKQEPGRSRHLLELYESVDIRQHGAEADHDNAEV